LRGREPTKSMSKVRCNHCQHVQAVLVGQQAFVCNGCGTKLKRLSAPAKGS
jgi:ribosomal protein S27E